jgi:hypothetical protein
MLQSPVKKQVLEAISSEHHLLPKDQQFRAVQSLRLQTHIQHHRLPRAQQDPRSIHRIHTPHQPRLTGKQLLEHIPTPDKAGEAPTNLLATGKEEEEAVP